MDSGHPRDRDLALEVPDSPLEAVMSAEVWEQVYRRLAGLVEQHRTTLIFVNTRRMAERVTRKLSELLGETNVTAHHGSLAREQRLNAEQRLKTGKLKALVATASLELGIDIGDVDLVCQLGSSNGRRHGCRHGGNCCAFFAGSRAAARSVEDVSSLGFPASSLRCPTPLACCAKFDDNRMPIPGSPCQVRTLNLAGILTPRAEDYFAGWQPGALSGWRTDGFVVAGRSDLFQRTRSGNRMASPSGLVMRASAGTVTCSGDGCHNR